MKKFSQPFFLLERLAQHDVDREKHKKRDSDDVECARALGLELFQERQKAEHQEHSEQAPCDDGSYADIAVDVAPVEDDPGVVPEAQVEKLIEDVAARQLQSAAQKAAYEEDQPRLFAYLYAREEYQHRAHSVDRDPRAVGRAALEEFTLIDEAADLLVDEADDACEGEDEHQ